MYRNKPSYKDSFLIMEMILQMISQYYNRYKEAAGGMGYDH